MDTAEALQAILRKLAAKRTALEGKIKADSAEKSRLEDEISALRSRVEQLDAGLSVADAEFHKLDETIRQTEAGYQGMLDTAQTLMDIVSQNMAALEAIDIAPVATGAPPPGDKARGPELGITGAYEPPA